MTWVQGAAAPQRAPDSGPLVLSSAGKGAGGAHALAQVSTTHRYGQAAGLPCPCPPARIATLGVAIPNRPPRPGGFNLPA